MKLGEKQTLTVVKQVDPAYLSTSPTKDDPISPYEKRFLHKVSILQNNRRMKHVSCYRRNRSRKEQSCTTSWKSSYIKIPRIV